jgi:hypothetical protein
MDRLLSDPVPYCGDLEMEQKIQKYTLFSFLDIAPNLIAAVERRGDRL